MNRTKKRLLYFLFIGIILSVLFSSGQVENPDTHLRLTQTRLFIETGQFGLPDDVGEDTHGNSAGSVYLFKRESDSINDVTQLAKLQASDAESGDNFGTSVSIDNNVIVIGAYKEDAISNDSGAVYIFKHYSDDNITEITKIKTENPTSNDYFGFSVAIDQESVVVSANREDSSVSDTGSSYVYIIDENQGE